MIHGTNEFGYHERLCENNRNIPKKIESSRKNLKDAKFINDQVACSWSNLIWKGQTIEGHPIIEISHSRTYIKWLSVTTNKKAGKFNFK